jgi:hypothetical protein
MLLLSILNSSQASPGSFISAKRSNLFSDLSAISTRQKVAAKIVKIIAINLYYKFL